LLDWRGIVTENWKYAHFETGEEWLFDLENDPYEQNNLAEANPQKKTEMRKKLLALLAETREPYYDVLMEHPAPVEYNEPVIDVRNLTKQDSKK